MKTPRKLVCLLPLVLVVGGCAQLGLFTFDDGLQDVPSIGSQWTPGDPWDQRTTTTITDSRDTSLEDHVNADYVRRTFAVAVQQATVTVTSAAQVATYTRGARVHVELVIAMTATSGVGPPNEIRVQLTGLPAGLPSTVGFGNTLGTFYYQRVTAQIITGVTTWDGTYLHLWKGGQPTAQVGIDPSFLLATGDLIMANFSYIPAIDT